MAKVIPIILKRAREMRHPQTAMEARLWMRLRDLQLLEGLKFRRQHPIGRFIVDFCCAEKRLVIEVDGDTHAAPGQIAYDAERTRWLEEAGCRVLRFTNDEVRKELDEVVEDIARKCGR